MNDAPRREPEIFAAGDTLWFTRFLPEYLPGNGWSLLYVLTDEGGHEVFSVQSVAKGDAHEIKAIGFGQALPKGSYIFAGYVVNAQIPARHQIYYSDHFILTPDLADGTAQGPIQTHAQKMIGLLEQQLEYMASHVMQLTESQRNHYEMVTRPDLQKQLREYKEIRNNEVEMERVRSGQRPRNVVSPVFNVG